MGVLLWQALYGVGHLSYSHRKKKTTSRNRHRRRLRMVSIQHGRLQLPVLRRAGARRAPREVVCLPSGLHALQTNTTR